MSIINNQLFLSKIAEIVNKTSGALLLSIPGVSEILTEFFNNDALDELRDEELGDVDFYPNGTLLFEGKTYKTTDESWLEEPMGLTPYPFTVTMTFGEFMDMNPQEIKGGGSSEQIYTDL